MRKSKKEPRETRLKTRPHCPICGNMLDSYASVGEKTEHPGPGDFSICFYCGNLMTFGGRPLTLKKVNDEQRKIALSMPDIQKAFRVVQIRNAVRGFGPSIEDDDGFPTKH